MKSLGIVACIVLLAAACSQLNEKPAVVDFVMKDYKLESVEGCKSDTSMCATFEVQYPDFIGLDTTVRRSIEDKVNFILNGSSGDAKSIDAMAKDFIADFESFKKEMPGFGLGSYFRGKVRVLISTDTLISLQVDTESFTGGAHASYTTNFVNVEPKTGTSYLLDAMLKPGYVDELNRLGEEDLRNQLAASEADSIEMLEFPDGKFKLNENYGFRKEGIVFYFNDYEIAPFSEGPTEILIPYEKLQDWMK
jgi:Protein of unknown function (DUF3298)/Deacetylase PdaC